MCDRPLKGFKIGYTKNGKPDYLICSPEVKYVYKDSYGHWHKSYDYTSSDFAIVSDVVRDFQIIPCGSCLSCRINRAGEMADRCMLEMKYHDEACFVTLTYSDDFLIQYNYRRRDTGEVGTASTLFKKHYVDFIKRLRKAYPGSDIRYVLCGEYGEQSDRPHYHAIIFGFKPHDLIVYSYNKRNQPLYISEELNRLWRLGFCIVGDVTKDSANYVTRYVTKKLYSDLGSESYQAIGRIPPFIVSSKRPAIGKRWYDDNKDWCFDHQISYSTDTGGRSFNAPRYFKKLRDKEGCSSLYLDVKDDQKNRVNSSQLKHNRDFTDHSFEDMAEAKERNMNAKNKAFMRNGI